MNERDSSERFERAWEERRRGVSGQQDDLPEPVSKALDTADRLARADSRVGLHQRLAELEESPERAVATSASLIRYATTIHMVHGMLPSGRTVTYAAPEGEEIPTIPVGDALEPESAITARTDAIVEEGASELAGVS